ncbi:MAG: COG4280 domain-containing protein [Ktedonobacterales bacterium]
MTGQLWAVAIAAFLASCVEFVEAFTIVLVVGVTVNWRSSLVGAAAAAGALAVIVAVFGTAIVTLIPLEALRLVVGLLLVLFGMKWLKKAILRYAGLKAIHDEEAIYEEHLAELRARGEAPPATLDPFGVVTSFKSVLLEGLEVAFIVITFGLQANSKTQKNGIPVAAIGAVAAFIVIVALGSVVRAPLQRVPENMLKFVVGVMLASFGTFWGGEGLGITWWHSDLSLPILVVFYLVVALGLIQWLRPYAPARQVKASVQRDRREQEQRPVEKEVLG